jgi:hypothetical protein
MDFIRPGLDLQPLWPLAYIVVIIITVMVVIMADIIMEVTTM